MHFSARNIDALAQRVADAEDGIALQLGQRVAGRDDVACIGCEPVVQYVDDARGLVDGNLGDTGSVRQMIAGQRETQRRALARARPVGHLGNRLQHGERARVVVA